MVIKIHHYIYRIWISNYYERRYFVL